MIQPLTLIYISNRKKLPYYVFKFVERNGRVIVFSLIIFYGLFRIFYEEYIWYYLGIMILTTLIYNFRNYFSLEIRKGLIELTNDGIKIDSQEDSIHYSFEEIEQLRFTYEYDTFLQQEKINDTAKLRVYNNFIIITTCNGQFIYPFLIDQKKLFHTLNSIFNDFKNNHGVNVKQLNNGDSIVGKVKKNPD